MNGTTSEWVKKAEGDFVVAELAFGAAPEPNYDAVCFHCQQCVEKLIKAVLIQAVVQPPKIHNLERLYEMLQTVHPGVFFDIEELRMLTSVGMSTRYPGEEADREDASQALAVCKRLRESILNLIRERPK